MRVRNFSTFSLKEILLESVMYSSSDLATILYNMYYKEGGAASRIAGIIRDSINGLDIKTNYNALDLSPNKNDELSFIPDSQFQKSKEKSEDPWARQKSNTKVGRLVRQVLKDNGHAFVDKDIEDFVNAFKAAWDKKNGVYRKIQVVTGDDILFWYSDRNYANRSSGTLGSSCMKSPNDNDYMRIYAGNPDKISLVILTDEDKLIARALLWKLDESTMDKSIYLDRIYTLNDSDVKFVYNWVFENIAKEKSDIFGHYDDDDTHGEMKVNLENVDFDEYPYADTMSYLYKAIGEDGKLKGGGFLSNDRDLGLNGYIAFNMTSTSGRITPYTHVFCDKLDSWFRKDKVTEIYDGSDYPEEMTAYSRALRASYPKNELSWSEKMNDWIPTDNAIDDPKFGIVLRSYIVEVVKSYKGESIYPCDIAMELIQGDVENFEIDRDVIGSSVFKIKLDGSFKYFSKDIVIVDAFEFQMPEFLTIKGYKSLDLVEGDKIANRLTMFREASLGNDGHFYITKPDALYYNLKIDESKSIDLSLNVLKTTLPYYEYRNVPIEGVNDSYKDKYDEYITSIHEYMMETSSTYRDNYLFKTSIQRVGESVESLLVDVASKSIKYLMEEDDMDEEYTKRAIKRQTYRASDVSVNVAYKMLIPYALFYMTERADRWDAFYKVVKYIEEVEDSAAPQACELVYEFFGDYFRHRYTRTAERILGEILGDEDGVQPNMFLHTAVRSVSLPNLFKEIEKLGRITPPPAKDEEENEE